MDSVFISHFFDNMLVTNAKTNSLTNGRMKKIELFQTAVHATQITAGVHDDSLRRKVCQQHPVSLANAANR